MRKDNIAVKLDKDSYIVDSRGTAPNGSIIRKRLKEMAEEVRKLYPVEKDNG